MLMVLITRMHCQMETITLNCCNMYYIIFTKRYSILEYMRGFSKTELLFGNGFICAFYAFLLLTLIPSWGEAKFSFVVTSDQRKYAGPGKYDSRAYFRGAVKAIQTQGKGAFMISSGDIDPPENSKWTIEQVLGEEYSWFPVIGNHELPGNGKERYRGANMEWLRAYDYNHNMTGLQANIVNSGPFGCPTTTFSFDYENAHFTILNVYCDSDGDTVTEGDIPDHLYNWIANDLATTSQEHIFVFGHEPAYPQADTDNNRERHMKDSLNAVKSNRDRFWNLLNEAGALAYFCGHTHNYSAIKIGNVWQLDSGHARGSGDKGAPSTFLIVQVDENTVSFSAYRDIHDGVYDYLDIVHTGTLTKE